MQRFLLPVMILFLSAFGQVQAQHFVLFEKYPQTYAQWYFETPTFPAAQIKAKYDEKFEIVSINYKDKRWFIAMRKNVVQSTQQYLVNPGNDVLQGKRNDGYTVVDFCCYIDGNYKQQTVYVMNKISNQPVNDTYIQYQLINTFSPAGVQLISMISGATQNNMRLESARVSPHPGHPKVEMYGCVIGRVVNNPPQQIWTTRPDYPLDYINNQTQQGYKLKSIVYSTYDKQWVVVMEENKAGTPWKIINYTGEASLKDAFAEGYTLVRTF